MNHKNQEVLAIIVIGALLALLLVGFIVSMLFLYKKRQNEHEKELHEMQEDYDRQILKVQFEIQELILSEISNKLHDSIKNNMVAVITELGTLQILLLKNKIDSNQTIDKLALQAAELNRIKDEIRLTSHSLSTDRIAQVGLLDAIAFEARRLNKVDVLKVNFINYFKSEYGFTQTESVYIFRMFQEVINNATTHAKATIIDIIAETTSDNNFILTVADNGVGFNVNEKRKSKLSGIGLNGLFKRAIQMGGHFEIVSKIGEGTKAKISLHLSNLIK